MHRETSKTPPTKAQMILTTSTTTIPSPALIHNITGLQTVAGAIIMTNRAMRQAVESEITFMTKDRFKHY